MNREDLLWTLVGVSFAHGYLASNLFSALFGLGLSAYVLRSRRKFKPKLEIKVEFPKRAEEMKKVRALLRVKNLGSDVKIRVKGKKIPELGIVENEPFVIKSGEEKFVETLLVPEKKGVYEVLLRVEVTDPKELYFEEINAGSYRLEVVPSVESIREAVKEDYNVRLTETYKKTLFSGMESIELEGLREYLPGDDIRRIDWKASSRLGELIVKVFMREWEGDVYIVLDSTKEMRKGLEKSKIDYASTLALHLAALLLRKNHKVGLIIYSERDVKVVKPSRGREQLNRIRNAVKFKPEKGLMSLKSSVAPKLSERGRRFMRKLFPKRTGVSEALLSIKDPSYIIIITDLMSHTHVLYRIMVMLRKKHRAVILSPNPILFCGEEVDRETLKLLYEKYIEREKTVRRFNTVVPTIDLGPSDYLREIVRELR